MEKARFQVEDNRNEDLKRDEVRLPNRKKDPCVQTRSAGQGIAGTRLESRQSALETLLPHMKLTLCYQCTWVSDGTSMMVPLL